MATEVLRSLTAPPTLEKKPQVAYKTEIIGGVVVQTPISQVPLVGAAGAGEEMSTVPKVRHIAMGYVELVERGDHENTVQGGCGRCQCRS